jgi:hypothetical protein
MTWFIDVRADSVGGLPASAATLRQGLQQCVDYTDFLQAVQGRNVLLGVHGFNVSRADGIAKLSAWESVLSLPPNCLFVGVLWPGDSRWAPVLDYPFEDQEAINSAALLADFLNTYCDDAASLSFASHSLGARVVLETLGRLQHDVTQVTLMAGAINDDCLNQQYPDVVNKLKRLAILASLGDDVLKMAFPLGNPLAGIISEGHPYWSGALGRYGPRSPRPTNLKSSWLIPTDWDYGHGDYLGGILPKVALPVTLPSVSKNTPACKPAWSAGFVSTQFRSAIDQ